MAHVQLTTDYEKKQGTPIEDEPPHSQSERLSKRNVLVALDFHEASRRAFKRALLETSRGRGSLHVLAVEGGRIDPMGKMQAAHLAGKLNLDDLKKKLDEELSALLAEFDPESSLSIEKHVAFGAPADCIVSVGRKLRADLILVGTHSRSGVKRFFLGSVSEDVLRKSGCSVLVVRENDWS